MDEKNLSTYENALSTLRPESAETLTNSILKSLRSEELRRVRRKALIFGLSVGSVCGATVALFLVIVFFRPETQPLVENIGAVAVEFPNREMDPLLDDLNVMLQNRQQTTYRPETESSDSSNRERIVARQLLQELSSGRPDMVENGI